jgi:molecular chaperone GrpE (heat shock protein)
MFNFLLRKLGKRYFKIDESFLPFSDADQPEDIEGRADITQELKKLGKWQFSMVNKLELLLAREKKDNMEREMINDFLPIIDGLETVLSAVPEGNLAEGLRILHAKAFSMLGKYEVFPIPSVEDPFDPSKHKAMGARPVALAEDNQIVQELKKGYFYKGEILRYSDVIVGKYSEEQGV